MSNMYNVAAELSVNNTKFIAGFAAAEASMKRFNSAMEKTSLKMESSMKRFNGSSFNASGMVSGIEKIGDASEKSRAKLEKFKGVASVAGKGGMAVIAAGAAGVYKTLDTFAKYESAFAGVKKTMDGTDEEFRKLDLSMRKMARSMPATYEEIAQVAENAGQLGIAKKDIEKFTKTMIMMGTSTNLSSDEAATSLARMMNIMGTNQKDVGKLASTIVRLGNAGASSEKDIVAMSMRLSGMGKEVGMSETEVLAMSAALSDLGVTAEMGGTAISKMMSDMGSSLEFAARYKDTMKELKKQLDSGQISLKEYKKAASDIGKKAAPGLQFAELLGLDKTNEAKNALKKFKDDAYGSFTLMIQGMEKAKAKGQNLTEILSNMKINDSQARDSIKRLIGGSDILKKHVANANDEWKKNTALTNEAAQRYKTFESQVKMAWNGIRNILANIGAAFAKSDSGLLETINGVINKVEKMTDSFVDSKGNISETGKQFVRTAKQIGGIIGTLTLVATSFAAFGPAGPVILAVAAGLGVIWKAADELYKKLNPKDAGLDKSLSDLDKGLSDVTKGKAEKYAKMADGINAQLTKMSIDGANVSEKTKKKIISDIKELTNEILNEINAKEDKILAINSRLMQSATGSEREMLKNNAAEIKKHFDRQRKVVVDAQKNLSNILSKTQTGTALNEDDYLKMETIFTALDKQYKMSVSKSITEMKTLDKALKDLGSSASEGQVQKNLTAYAKQTATAMAEVTKGYENQRKEIEASSIPERQKIALLASLAREYDQNKVGLLDSLSAYESQAQSINKNVTALKGLTPEQTKALGLTEAATTAINANDKAVFSLNGSQADLLNGTKSVSEALSIAKEEAAASKGHVDGLSHAYTGLGSSMMSSLETINTMDMSAATKAGMNFASKMKDGTMMVDIGEGAKMKVAEFVAGVRSGDITVQQAAIAQMNAVRSQYGAVSLTADGAQKAIEFANGLNSGKQSVATIAGQLGLSIKSGVQVDLGPFGQMSASQFVEGLKSGQYGVAEVTAMYNEKLKSIGNTDLSLVGAGTIKTLQNGITQGFLGVDQVFATFAQGIPNKATVNLTGSGEMTLATLKKGVENGSIPLSAAINAVKTSTKNGLTLDATDKGAHASNTFKTGIESGKENARAAAGNVKNAAQGELSKATDGGGGKKAGQSFIGGLLSFLNQAFNSGGRLRTNANNGLKGGNTKSLGQDFAQGYINGILSKATGVWNAAVSIATKAWNAIKRTQRSNSPSKVTAGLGNDFGDGYVLGINDRTSDAISAAQSLASGAINTLHSEAAGGAFALNDVLMPGGGVSLDKRVSHAVSANGSFELGGRQPAHINVAIGGQQFSAFAENIYENNIQRTNMHDNYEV